MYQVIVVTFTLLNIFSAFLAIQRHSIGVCKSRAGAKKQGLGSDVASPKYWRHASHNGFTLLICGTGNSCF